VRSALPAPLGQVTDEDLAAADVRIRASTRGMVLASFLLLVVVLLVAGLVVTTAWSSLDGMGLVLGLTGVTLGMIVPPVVAMARYGWNRSRDQLAASFARERELGVEARRREFETRLANALEMAENEEQVMIVAGRALRHVLPDASVELLLADNSHAHLQRAIVSGPSPTGPGCHVESPDRCVASRRGQTQVFDDSDALDACPYLEHRSYGRCAAVCVPVSIMGRTVGVVHRADPLPVDDIARSARPLEVLANQLGARLGMLRVMVESQLQASTDPLTGLPNRRAFENRVRGLHQRGAGYALVLADLDHFKVLNDTYGHESGDRALRTFAGVLRESLRDDDLLCRHGGEEFAFVLPGVSTHDALAACDRVRETLALVTHSGDVVPFTASFGVAMRADDMTYDQLRGAADVALYRAKHAGRNRAELAESAS
jgi:diguanylate cyclase (GGDEF)-like protein